MFYLEPLLCQGGVCLFLKVLRIVLQYKNAKYILKLPFLLTMLTYYSVPISFWRVRKSILQNCSKVATSSISAANVGKLIHKFQNPHQMGKVERIFANDKLRRKLFAAMTRNSVCDVFSVWVIYFLLYQNFSKLIFHHTKY